MSVIETNPKAVLNQPPPLRGYNMYEANVPLVEAVKREGAEWAHERCVAIGDDLNGELDELGRLANENPPKLKTHDRYGNRIDEVEFHPAWHWLMEMSVKHGTHALPWIDPRPGAHAARAALMLSGSAGGSGRGCPISMTEAPLPALPQRPGAA